MKTRFSLLMTVTLVTLLLLFTTSCDKYRLNSEGATPNLTKMSVSPLSSTTISVDWNNWTNGDKYTVAMAIADFGDIHSFTHAEQD